MRTDDGILLHTETDGPPAARTTVVFAHGFAARMEEYDCQRTALRDRSRLVFFDQRGHGRSGWVGHRSATIDRLGRDLGCVIDEVAAGRRVAIVGHSMGGMAVLALARQRPELFERKVAGVALLSTSAGHLAEAALPRAAARIALRTGLARGCLWAIWALDPLINLLGPFRTRLGRRWLRRRLFGRTPPRPETVSKMQNMWAEMSQSIAGAFYPAMIHYDAGPAVRVLRAVPTLILTGADDAAIPARHSRRLAREIGQAATLVTVPEAGHMVNMTHAHVVNTALSEFLERVESASDSRRSR